MNEYKILNQVNLFKRNELKSFNEDRKTCILNDNKYNIALKIVDLYSKENKSIFLVYSSMHHVEIMYELLVNIIDDRSKVLLFAVDEPLSSLMGIGSLDFRNERLYTLRSLAQSKPGENYIILTTYLAYGQYTLDKQSYLNTIRDINVGDKIGFNNLVQSLVNLGYIKTYLVSKPGEFSIRGGIIDCFISGSKHPIRLDFFDDEIEEIREFDPQTQRTIMKLKSVVLYARSELFYNEEELAMALYRINKYRESQVLSQEELLKYKSDLKNLEKRENLDNLLIYAKFFTDKAQTIFNFLDKKEMMIVSSNLDQINANYESVKSDLKSFSLTHKTEFYTKLYLDFSPQNLFENADIFIEKHTTKSLEKFKDISSFNIIDAKVADLMDYDNNLDLFLMDLKNLPADFMVFAFISNVDEMIRLQTFLEKYNTTKLKVEIVETTSMGAFCDYQNKVLVINEKKLFNIKIKSRVAYRSIIAQSKKIFHPDELVKGDFCVHMEYGICQYNGIKTLDQIKPIHDTLELEFKFGEKLYVPVAKINDVLKFSSYNEHVPILSQLKGSAWEKTKLSIKKKIHEISKNLVNLYAKRQMSVGFAFNVESEFANVFRNEFEYIETPDQLKAINDTFSDMEKTSPMDRLILGDVGFGKTEVALRATFKAFLSKKQVAYLVPTTVLAKQHYENFIKRLEHYGCKVALLSRNVKQAERKKTIEDIFDQKIDVIIGTHSLLSKDILFGDLGLLIIDEEQRFGVMHKEKIRSLKANCDTISLSATPIPRTMQMSLMGLKDMSVIDTPPLNRYPIQTFVIKRDDTIVKEAINRELAREGQIFYLFNNILEMDYIIQKIKNLVPQARVCFAHGKMSPSDIEATLNRFIGKEYDILVATTIIETGIDIPNSNTLIVHDATRLGLSQLYQLRGRVGRSDRIAYAYFLYDRELELMQDAFKRLEAIKEFTDLGSGYKIAMKDLSIRGAGDILGSEQSGFIDAIGIELYTKLVADEVGRLKLQQQNATSENSEILSENIQSFDIDEYIITGGFIRNEYINDDVNKIQVYKKIARLENYAQIQDLILELTDRFGIVDDNLIKYMFEVVYKKYTQKYQIKKTNSGVEIASISLGRRQISADFKEYVLSRVNKETIIVQEYDEQFNILFNMSFFNIQFAKLLVIFFFEFEGKCNVKKEVLYSEKG